jgi:trans-2,3-dihydro-3-hydroxyanthranilate isomerase
MIFYLTDVFGNERYSGNQLATFFDFGQISALEMQKIAREINFSETTFISSRDKTNGGYNVRIFTPEAEIEFAGHPVLGTALIINRYFESGNAKEIKLNLKAGQIPVSFSGDILWMRHNQPQFGRSLEMEMVAGLLGLDTAAIDERFPIQEVSTGLPFTIVPLKTMEDLQKVRIDPYKYQLFIKLVWAKGLLVFSPEGHEKHHDLSSRVFVDYLGVPEDPATGSATGCLAAYLVKHGTFGTGPLKMTIGQGYEMGRPSELMFKAGQNLEEYEILVGGKVIEIAKGEWKIRE